MEERPVSKLEFRLRRWWRGARAAAGSPAADTFRTVLETVQAVGVTLDVDGRITFANDFLLQLTGWRRHEVIGRNWFGLFVPADSEVQRLFRESVASGRIFAHHENEILARDGRPRMIAWDNVVLHDARGRVAGTASIGRDVTAERAATVALARSEAALAREREAERAARAAAEAERRRLRLVIDRLPLGVVVVDASGRAVHHNALAPQLLGHPMHAVGGVEEYTRYGGVHPDGRPYAADEYPSARALHGEVVEQELTHYRRENGTATILSISAAPVYEDGRLAYAVAAFQDVAARETAREALHAASEALREGDRRKDEFLAILAHELRNPLAPLRNAAEILRRSDDPSAGELARAMIERQLGQMARLVDDLLDVSRIATGKLKLHRDVLQLEEVVERAVETSRPRIDAQRHRLDVHLPAQPVRLRGDGIRLAQVLTNLLNNAAKYTEPGGSIALQVHPPGDGRVVVEVRDTGIGIAPDALASVFDLFAQVDAAEPKAQGGLGIGLTIARRIVELHGGSIRAASEGPGRGATFTVELPVADADAAPAPHDGSRDRRHAQCRVVVADDNRDTADSLAIMLRLSGHEVHVAYDGEDAVDLVRRHRPDVALVDIGMPRLDGYGVARRLRAEPWGDTLVLAALTGWGQASDRAAAAAAGFDHHFTKPVDPVAVEALLNGLPHCSRPSPWARLAAAE